MTNIMKKPFAHEQPHGDTDNHKHSVKFRILELKSDRKPSIVAALEKNPRHIFDGYKDEIYIRVCTYHLDRESYHWALRFDENEIEEVVNKPTIVIFNKK